MQTQQMPASNREPTLNGEPTEPKSMHHNSALLNATIAKGSDIQHGHVEIKSHVENAEAMIIQHPTALQKANNALLAKEIIRLGMHNALTEWRKPTR